MIKKILLIFCALVASVIAVLFVATTLRTPLLSDQYCKKFYKLARQCVPGCVWEFHEDEFTGYSITDMPLAPKNQTTCQGW